MQWDDISAMHKSDGLGMNFERLGMIFKPKSARNKAFDWFDILFSTQTGSLTLPTVWKSFPIRTIASSSMGRVTNQ